MAKRIVGQNACVQSTKELEAESKYTEMIKASIAKAGYLEVDSIFRERRRTEHAQAFPLISKASNSPSSARTKIRKNVGVRVPEASFMDTLNERDKSSTFVIGGGQFFKTGNYSELDDPSATGTYGTGTYEAERLAPVLNAASRNGAGLHAKTEADNSGSKEFIKAAD